MVTGGGGGRICDEDMELLEVLQIFGMWFDQHAVGKSAFGKDSTCRKAEGW